MQETLRHQQAFEYYYMLGANRNYSRVAEHFGVSNVSITKWADAFSWKDRVKERDFLNMEEVRKKNNDDVKEEMEAYRKIIKASIATFIKDLKNNKVKIESINDFAKLVRLDMELSGVISDIVAKDMNSDDIPTFGFNGRNKGDGDDAS